MIWIFHCLFDIFFLFFSTSTRLSFSRNKDIAFYASLNSNSAKTRDGWRKKISIPFVFHLLNAECKQKKTSFRHLNRKLI